MLVFGFELDVGVAVSVSRERQRPGEQTYYAVSSGPIDAERVRAQIREAGLTMLTDDLAKPRGEGPMAIVAHRGSQTLTVNFSGAPWNTLYVSAVDHDELLLVVIESGTFRWAGRAWPAYFDAGRIESDDDGDFIVTATVDPAADPIARYRAWALESAFEIEDPLNDWEAEPDLWLERGVRFRDERFRVQADVEDGTLTLYISRAAKI
ncbi:MAG: hypothetical protein JNL21_09670 [Myxococcales bacterium]|nr:hypothetical protein [Myxococcales bacterium]